MWFLIPALASAAEPVPTTASVDQLRWLEGCWSAIKNGGAVQQECWSPAQGGLMLGTNIDANAKGGVFFEFLRIEGTGGELTYIAQPRGGTPVPFRVTSLAENEVVFENPAHDFPKKIRYQRTGDTLTGSIAGDGKEIAWTWKRSATKP